jgi:hypothetical protein
MEWIFDRLGGLRLVLPKGIDIEAGCLIDEFPIEF